MKKCPYCAEEIQDAAIVCRYCGQDLEEKPNIFIIGLVYLRNFVGMVQSLTVLGGCAGVLAPSDVILSASIQWFIILLVVQLIILLLIYIFSRGDLWRKIGGIAIGIVGVVAILWLILSLSGGVTATAPAPASTRTSHPPTLTPRSWWASTPRAATRTPQAKALMATMLAATEQASCFHWSQVDTRMVGKEICVYGDVYNTRYVGNSWSFQVLFAADEQAFFLAAGTYEYTLDKGECVVAEGVVQKSSVGVPYIDIDDALYDCEP